MQGAQPGPLGAAGGCTGAVPRDARGSTGQPARGRRSYRGHRVAGPARGSRPFPGLKGRYYADLFSGTGGVGRAVARTGFVGRCWERADGRSGDLGDPQTLSRFLRDVKDGKVLGASLAPPCGSFSIARDRTMKVRSRRCPWGYARLPPHERIKVDEGNEALRITLQIVDALNSADVPWIWENPATSRMWLVPEVRRHLQDPRSVRIVADQCGFGARWRKRSAGHVFGQAPQDLRHERG